MPSIVFPEMNIKCFLCSSFPHTTSRSCLPSPFAQLSASAKLIIFMEIFCFSHLLSPPFSHASQPTREDNSCAFSCSILFVVLFQIHSDCFFVFSTWDAFSRKQQKREKLKQITLGLWKKRWKMSKKYFLMKQWVGGRWIIKALRWGRKRKHSRLWLNPSNCSRIATSRKTFSFAMKLRLLDGNSEGILCVYAHSRASSFLISNSSTCDTCSRTFFLSQNQLQLLFRLSRKFFFYFFCCDFYNIKVYNFVVMLEEVCHMKLYWKRKNKLHKINSDFHSSRVFLFLSLAKVGFTLVNLNNSWRWWEIFAP